MRKFLASAVLIMALSVPTLAGYIDQTGAPCNPSAQSNCIYVEGPSTNNASTTEPDGIIDFLTESLSALLGIG